MIRRLYRILAAVVTLSLVTLGLTAGFAQAEPEPPSDPIPSQTQIDGSASDSGNEGWTSGGWSDATGGVSARPYVKSLRITNDGTTTSVITEGPEGGVPTSANTSDNLTAIVVPINVCKQDQVSNCYPSPNRVQVTLAYQVDGAWHYDLEQRSPEATPKVDSNTVIDLELGLNVTGSTLGWTWANGNPSYWNTTGVGSDAGTLRIKYKPGDQPQVPPGGEQCSAIPVTACDVQQATSDLLVGTIVLSLDNTLGSAFAGALFATDGAIIGSLEKLNGPDNQSQLMYGAASTHLLPDSSLRTGTIRAVLSSSILSSEFGITGDPASQLLVQRTNDVGTTGAISWTPWSGSSEGTDGYLVTISGITFSAPIYAVKKKSAPAPTKKIRPGVKAAAVKRASSLSIRVTPKRSWKIQVQVRKGKNWKTVVRSHTNSKGLWLKNLKKGTYRVLVPTQSKYLSATSKSVKLKR